MIYNNSNGAQAVRVERAKANLPQSTSAAIFTVSGGKVLVCDIIGEVDTTVIEAGANNMKLTSTPTVGAAVDLCAVLDIAADAVGTMYHITGTLAGALVATTSGAFESQATPIAVAPGTIDLNCDASKTGKIKWTLFYIPIDSGATVVKV
jgi:hypothetical protein